MVDVESARRVLEAVSIDDLATDVTREAYRLCADLYERDGAVDFHRLLDSADERLKGLLVQIDHSRQSKTGAETGRRLQDVVAAFQRRRDDAHRRGEIAALREGRLDNHEEEEKLSQFFAKLKDRQTGPLSTEG